MLPNGLNDNIQINNLYYFGLYQDEEKNERSKNIWIFIWVGTKQKGGAHFSIDIGIFYRPTAQSNGRWVQCDFF